jgi:hypothetical protein
MIEISLNYLRSRLNTALSHAMQGSEDDIVELSRLDAADSSAKEKVIIQLVRIEKITSPHQPRIGHGGQGRQSVTGQPIYLNLYVLIGADFGVANYPQALAYISQVIGFLQDNGVFERHNSPDMPPQIDKLCFEVENVGSHDLSSIWGMVGAKYIPSVIYKVSLLALGGDVKGQQSSMSQPAHPKTGQR